MMTGLHIETVEKLGCHGINSFRTEFVRYERCIPLTRSAGEVRGNRSQHRNRAQAYDMLRARLYEHELKKRDEAAQALEDTKTDIGWGHQIRSYVLQPYQMVKDLRTNVETSNTQAVLDGDLDQFMEAALAARLVRCQESFARLRSPRRWREMDRVVLPSHRRRLRQVLLDEDRRERTSLGAHCDRLSGRMENARAVRACLGANDCPKFSRCLMRAFTPKKCSPAQRPAGPC